MTDAVAVPSYVPPPGTRCRRTRLLQNPQPHQPFQSLMRAATGKWSLPVEGSDQIWVTGAARVMI